MVIDILVSQGITRLCMYLEVTWEADIRVVSGNDTWENMAWPVAKKACYYFMCEFKLPTTSLLKSHWSPIWEPDYKI